MIEKKPNWSIPSINLIGLTNLIREKKTMPFWLVSQVRYCYTAHIPQTEVSADGARWGRGSWDQANENRKDEVRDSVTTKQNIFLKGIREKGGNFLMLEATVHNEAPSLLHLFSWFKISFTWEVAFCFLVWIEADGGRSGGSTCTRASVSFALWASSSLV